MPALTADMERQDLKVDDLLIDRAYINSGLVDAVLKRRGKIVCKPWKSRNGDLFTKVTSASTFAIAQSSVRRGRFSTSHSAPSSSLTPTFAIRCPMRDQCTTAEYGNRRSVAISDGSRAKGSVMTSLSNRSTF